MKFLVDNQLPSALARWIEERGFPAAHVLELGLAEATDSEIFEYAVSEHRVLVSKDEDFLHLTLRAVSGAAFVWVRIGNCRNGHLLDAFGAAWRRIVDGIEAGERILEIR